MLGPVVRTGQQELPPLYAQGVARIPGGWIFSGTNSLWKTDDNLKELMHTGPSIPDAWKAKGFDHIGDIDVVGKYIYAPFEEPDYSKGHQATARFDRVTLQFVDAVMLPQHQNSFVTIDPATMTAYTTDQFDGDTLLRYDVAHGWKPLAAAADEPGAAPHAGRRRVRRRDLDLDRRRAEGRVPRRHEDRVR